MDKIRDSFKSLHKFFEWIVSFYHVESANINALD